MLDKFVTLDQFRELVAQQTAMNMAFKDILRREGINLQELEMLRLRHIAHVDQKMEWIDREHTKEIRKSQ